MKKWVLPLAAALLAVFLASPAWAFWCGTRLVHIGDTRFDVQAKCGAPDWTETYVEQRLQTFSFPIPPGSGKDRLGRFSQSLLVPSFIEEWYYNLGPRQFVRILVFENSRLIYIKTAEYGY
jgi:hypothetical protein